MIRHHHSLLREALDVGLVGLGTATAWFLLADWIAGHPMQTPSTLGQVLQFGRSTPALGLVHWQSVAAYTLFHVLVFGIVAIPVVWLVHFAIRNPSWLAAYLILFASAELFFYGATYALLTRAGAESLWGSVLVANFLVVLAIGGYLWRGHRIIGRWLARVPLGDTGDEAEVNTSAAWHAMRRWRVSWWKRGAGSPA